MSANDRTGVGAGTAEWGTPPELFARLDRRFRFDYDPFASHENAKCERYSTVDGTFRSLEGSRLTDQKRVTEADEDGLVYDWSGLRVFCNPPYSRNLIELCIEKIIAERDRAEIIVVLVNAATETAWFRSLMDHSFIEWLPKRVQYIHPSFRCVDRNGVECMHELGVPLRNSPGGGVVALLRSELMPNGKGERA